MSPVRPVLLSGGAGTRLWPLSRAGYPKQLLALVSEESLLQETARRFSGAGFLAPYLICSEAHRFVIAEQLREIGIAPAAIVLEPCARNTAPAAAIAALLAAREDPDAILLLTPTDHTIEDATALRAAILKAAPLAASGRLVCFGVAPRGPHAGYGYIRQGAALSDGAFALDAFIEKPDEARAAALIAEGGHLWNSGMFLLSAQAYLGALATLRPAMLARCTEALDGATVDLDFRRLAAPPFEAIAGESIDYAVMEQARGAAVVPIEVGWSDVGSWRALADAGTKDGAGNVAHGDVVIEGSRGSYVRSEGPLVVALGLDDALVVATGDAVLVARLDAADGVRAVVERLARAGRAEAAGHALVHRPWGSYEEIRAGARYKVKLIRVKPGAALSLQYHNRRAEHWVVVGGEAVITHGDTTTRLAPDQSLYVPLGVRHRLANPGDAVLEVIEVQTGDYLEEDDIIRLDDRYGRGNSG
ncbi:MAG: mannose-1-phosphate guanylyltransferase/mannose-6-phosphate isomerase [Alphaproteobacteria bacterium]